MIDLANRLDSWAAFIAIGYECPAAGPVMTEAAARIRLLEQQLKTAREEERERCAKTVEANAAIVDHPSVYMGGPSQTAKRVAKGFAAAIRSLGEKE